MGSGRGVVRTLAATLLFLVLELLYGVALMVLCVLMLGGLGLLLLCICSTSTRSSRVFVAWMWRNELWLNGLVVDKQERASSRGYERVSSESHLPTQAARREVTSSVMIFSVLYFLVFRGIFNVVFSVFPLAMWYAALIQAVPSAALESDMVVGAEISSRLFVALVTSFFAYQVSVASARASVFVSEKIQSVLFREPAYPTTETNALRQNSGITQYDSARQDNVLPELFLHENRYGDELRPRSVGRPFPQDARWPARGGAPSSSSSAPPPPAPPPPPMPPMPPMSGGYPYGPPPHARDRQHPLDEEFRADTNVHEYDFCGVKVLLRRESDPDELSPRRRDRHDAPWRRGRHRGYDDRGGMGRRGGRGAHGGRGSFYYYQEEPYPVQVESVPAVSDTAHEPVGPPAKYTASVSKPSCNDRSRGRRRDERSSRGRSDSVDRGFSRAQADLDLKHGHRSRLCEALDLRPSAPPLSESHQDEFGSPWRSELYPMARPAELYPLRVEPPVMSRHIQKSMSDMGRQRMDEEDVFEGSRKLDFIATKQMWKEHARRLKLEAKRIKNAYKAKWKQDARDLKEKQKEQDRILKEQERVIKEQERLLKEREQLARAGEIAADKPRDAALPGHAIPNQGLTVGGPKPSSVRHTQRQEQYQAGVPDDDEEKQSIRVQEDFAMEIQQAAQEQVEKQQQELLFDSRKTGTLHTSTNSNVTVSADASDEPRSGTRPIIRGRRLSALNDIDLLMFGSSTDDSRVDIAPSSDYRTFASNLFQTGVSMDQEFGRMYDSYSRSMESYSRSIDDRDYTGLDRFNDVYSATPIAITSLQTPLYRSTNGAQGLPSGRSVSGYDTFSPESSPRGSFIVNSFVDPHPYDSMSPTGNRPEAEFPSEDFQQVYRSLRYRDDNRVVPSQISSLPNYEDVPGERDKVHFCSYAPPSVFPSKQSFRFAVWAFLLNQKQEMREQAEASDPEARQMSMDAKMVVRRGAFVHVTLEVPTGFRILNEPTQGLPWEGTISHIDYDILCTDEADFGQVVFKATIVVGTEVAVLRSYMIVSSKKLEASELDAKVLESQLEVLEVTYQEVPYPMLELKELVGSGYFGDAYRATYNGQDVVVKTIRASEFGETNDQILKEFQHEAAVLSMFGHHPCVVPFVGASTDMRYPLSLITQYLPYGSLEDNLKTPEKQSSLSVRQRSSMLRDAAAGLLNVHEGGFIHRDIAARNCLVDENLRVKICDFGLCRRVNAYGGSLMKDSVGPIKYMAPESLQLPHSFSFDSDSWMFGVLMWETYNASPPYPDMTPLQAGMSVLRGDRLPIPQHIPQRLQELIQSCFLDAPSDRPSMGDIVSELDQYLTSTNVASSTARSLQPSANVIGNSAVPSMVLGTSHAALERRDRSIWV